MARLPAAVALVALCLLLPLGTAAATPKAVVTAGRAMGLRGGTDYPVAVSLKSTYGAQVAALNFDLTFDSSRLSVGGVTIGSAASLAGKSLSWSQPAANRIRVLIVGINQDAIPDGPIASVSFNVLGDARRGATPLALSSVTASDPTSLPVSSKLVNGSFRVVSRLR